MTTCTANTVADFYLNFCGEHGDVLTNLKIQKLVYYAQAWHLALKGVPLFDDEIQAWVHGPVVPSLYGRFKKYGWQPIPIENKAPDLAKETQDFLTEVFGVYGRYSGWDLERMTHQEYPWLKARGGIPIDEECTNPIAHADMQEFYSSLSKN